MYVWCCYGLLGSEFLYSDFFALFIGTALFEVLNPLFRTTGIVQFSEFTAHVWLFGTGEW